MSGETRPGINFYLEDLENILDVLQEKEVVELFKSCVHYVQYGVVPELEGNEKRLLRSIWRPLRGKLDRDGKAYDTKKIKAMYSRFCRTYKTTNLGKEAPDFETWYETIYSPTNVENEVRFLPYESESAPESETEPIPKTVTSNKTIPKLKTANGAKGETEGSGGEEGNSPIPNFSEIDFERTKQEKMDLLRAFMK